MNNQSPTAVYSVLRRCYHILIRGLQFFAAFNIISLRIKNYLQIQYLTSLNIPHSWHVYLLSCQDGVIWPVSVPRHLYLRHFTPVQHLSHLTKLSPDVRLSIFLYFLSFPPAAQLSDPSLLIQTLKQLEKLGRGLGGVCTAQSLDQCVSSAGWHIMWLATLMLCIF